MLTVNSSNEYKVALSMYQDSQRLFTKVLGEIYTFWEKEGYDVDIFYANDYHQIKIKCICDKEMNKEKTAFNTIFLLNFCSRFKLKLVKTSQTVDKDTMIGKYSKIVFYYFEGA